MRLGRTLMGPCASLAGRTGHVRLPSSDSRGRACGSDRDSDHPSSDVACRDRGEPPR
jgi:hypothetical protein